MKFLGVEFYAFGPFETQYIPITAGINLLAGRNNAGKTALLRGLAVLGNLPFGPPSTLNPPMAILGEYCHSSTPQPQFRFDIVLSYLDGEPNFFPNHPPGARRAALADAILRYRFTAWPRTGNVDFEEASLLAGTGRALPGGGPATSVLELVQGQITAKYFNLSDLRVETSIAQRPSVSYPNPSGQIRSRIQLPNPFFDQVAAFSSVKVIDPHRVAAPQLSLQTAKALSGNAAELPAFLQTLQGNEIEKYNQIQEFVCGVFPEFKYVSPASHDNHVSIQLTERATNRKIPLTHCGTGVEQILTLATYIVTELPGSLLLIDEPHSYLHPVAERLLVHFLASHPEHTYLISTHSSVLINSVESCRVSYVAPPGEPFARRTVSAERSRVLFDLGYRNSDALFHDRLIIVEGKSDRTILPILLSNTEQFGRGDLEATGFPQLEGVGKGTSHLFSAVRRYEDLLTSVGKSRQPRLYLFDGDRNDDQNREMRGWKTASGEALPLCLLQRAEIENYLLVPVAIFAAMKEEADSLKIELAATPASIENEIKSALKGKDLATAKGSQILEYLYSKYALPHYSKERHGRLISLHVTLQNQPGLTEIIEAVRPILSTATGGT